MQKRLRRKRVVSTAKFNMRAVGTLCDAAVGGSVGAGMVITVVVLYGLAVVLWRALRAPPLVVDFREGEILE